MPEPTSQASPASAQWRFQPQWLRWLLLATLVVSTAAVTFAQRSRDPNSRSRSSDPRMGVPEWAVDKELSKDIFTFVRLQYASAGGRYGGGGWGGRRWAIDYPDAELNLSYRLQEMTSLKVNPNPIVLEITNPDLLNYPWCYMVEPGGLQFSDEEVIALRKYLLNGGFLMVDDFWGPDEWDNFYYEIKRVFPDREPVEIPMDHPIFHCVFPLKLEKNNMQVPNVGLGTQSQYNGGRTWEDDRDRNVHFKAISDDKGRMMVMICHNTDNGDGWEREGENEYYFREFSEKKAFPLGINIIFYAMTH
jgi:hypothetical protein